MVITLISSGNCTRKAVVIILNTVGYLVSGEQEVAVGQGKSVTHHISEPHQIKSGKATWKLILRVLPLRVLHLQ